MLKEIYNYIDKLPKDFGTSFEFKDNICCFECFGIKWYFDAVRAQEKETKETTPFEYLLNCIQKIELPNKIITNKKIIEYLLQKTQHFIFQHLYSIAEKLKISYLYHQIQFIPFIFKQIDEGDGRVYWRVFKSFGFKNPKDPDFRKIISNQVLLKWTTSNIIKDQEEEFEKMKTLQFFVNPQLYNEIYKQTKLTKDLERKVDAIYSQIKARRK